jgi:hypothetical protein
MHRFNAEPVVYLFYRKPLGDNIYKQWELGRGNGCLVRIGTWVIGENDTKGEGGKGVDGWGKRKTAGFCVPCVCLDIFPLWQ